MNARELTLNIAVNLGRIGRWAREGKKSRVTQFLEETNEYLKLLDQAERSHRFDRTLQSFKVSYHELSSEVRFNDEWAEDIFTWANILTHRARLA